MVRHPGNNKALWPIALFFLLLIISSALVWRLTLPNQSDSQTVQVVLTKQPSTLPLRELWCLESSTSISRPMYSEGLVYTLDGKDWVTLNAYLAMTGELSWTVDAPNDAHAAGTLGYWSIEDNFVIIGAQSSITAFEAKTGKTAWQAEPWNAGFAAGGRKVFVGGPEFIRAYDIATGDLIWEIAGQGRGWSQAPLYDPVNNVVVLNEATYRLLDPDTGSVLLDIPRLPESDFSYDFNGGQLYDGLLLYVDEAFEVTTGKLIHLRTVPGSQSLHPFVFKNHLLLSDFADVVAVRLNDFTEVWRYHSPLVAGRQLEVVGDPVAMDAVVYVILSDASLRALDFTTGNEIGLWQGREAVDRRFGRTPLVPGMAVGDGMLFASFGTNELCAFGE